MESLIVVREVLSGGIIGSLKTSLYFIDSPKITTPEEVEARMKGLVCEDSN